MMKNEFHITMFNANAFGN